MSTQNDPQSARAEQKNGYHKPPAPADILSAYVPPHDIAVEQCVLGAMLIEQPAIDKARAMLDKDDFYRDTHQHLFATILDMADANVPVDLETMRVALGSKLDWIGGMSYLTSMFERLPTAANIDWYAKIVKDKSIRRQGINAATLAIACYRDEDSDIESVVERAHAAALSVGPQRADGRGPVTLREIMPAIWDEAEAVGDGHAQRRVLTTGIPGLDNMLGGGFNYDDYVIIAGRASMGKTWAALYIAEHVALTLGKGVYFVSQEMDRMRVGRRVLATRSGITTTSFRGGFRALPVEEREAAWGKLAAAVQETYTHLFCIDDRAAMTPGRIAAGARHYASQLRRSGSELGLIVVDYLGLCRADERQPNRNLEIGSISSGLFDMGKEMGVTTIALSQLSRAVDSRDDHRPMLSDLRDSGSIEQDADTVIFPYRESYYRRQQKQEEDNETATADEMEMIVGKARDGRTGYTKCWFVPSLGQYLEHTVVDSDGKTGF